MKNLWSDLVYYTERVRIPRCANDGKPCVCGQFLTMNKKGIIIYYLLNIAVIKDSISAEGARYITLGLQA